MLTCWDETDQLYSPWSSLFRFDICRDRFPGEVLFNNLTRPVCLGSWGYISSEFVVCSGVNVHVSCFGLASRSVHEQGRMTYSPERPVTLIVCSFWSRLHTDNTCTIVICTIYEKTISTAFWKIHISGKMFSLTFIFNPLWHSVGLRQQITCLDRFNNYI